MVDAQVLSLQSKVMKLGRLKLAHLATKIHIVWWQHLPFMTLLPTMEMSITSTEFNSSATRADDQMSCICRVHARLSVLYQGWYTCITSVMFCRQTGQSPWSVLRVFAQVMQTHKWWHGTSRLSLALSIQTTHSVGEGAKNTPKTIQ